jgi:hypothetical protein
LLAAVVAAVVLTELWLVAVALAVGLQSKSLVG